MSTRECNLKRPPSRRVAFLAAPTHTDGASIETRRSRLLLEACKQTEGVPQEAAVCRKYLRRGYGECFK